MKDFLSSTFLLVLVLDPFALALMIPSLLRAVPAERHMRVVVREMVFGLILLLVFLLAGEKILDFFGLEESTLSISGGIVLFLIALGMVFPGIASITSAANQRDESERLQVEPFIVPIAIPLFAGPSSLAIVMLNGSKFLNTPNFFVFLASLILAWLVSLTIVLFSPKIVKKLGRRGSVALERFVGVLLILISVQMILGGFSAYTTVHPIIPAAGTPAEISVAK